MDISIKNISKFPYYKIIYENHYSISILVSYFIVILTNKAFVYRLNYIFKIPPCKHRKITNKTTFPRYLAAVLWKSLVDIRPRSSWQLDSLLCPFSDFFNSSQLRSGISQLKNGKRFSHLYSSTSLKWRAPQ